ncbi:MAG: minor capsid protein [Candidatus Paceibacterota bacterium]
MSKDIVTILEDESSLGLTFPTNLGTGKEPTSPSNTVTIFDTGGQPPQLTLDIKGLEYPSVQIRVRNINYQTGWALIESIKTVLHGLSQVTVNGTLYSVIYCASGPALLDWDDNSRARFIINFSAARRAT